MKLTKRFIQQTFSVHLFETNGRPFDVSVWKLLKSILSDRSFVKYNPVQVVADPFLFVHDDWLFMFYEKQISINNGTIEMIKTKDLINWTKPTIILEHDERSTYPLGHFSYPFVFKDGDSVFMMPETHGSKNVQLYKANQDLSKWSLLKEILNGDVYVDSSIFQHNNIYYLFTTVIKSENQYELHLFFSESLYGEFEEHPKSPIAIGNFEGRCGGAIFDFENRIYRPSQICENYYGESISIFNIKALTTNDYQEEIEISRLLSKQFKKGGDHFNIVTFNNKLIIATDAVNFTFNFFVFCDMMLKRIKRVFHGE